MPSTARSFEQAITHHQAGRLAEAERDYLATLQNDGRHADALRLLAALYVQIDRPDRAIEFFERAHAAQPDNPETLNNLGVALRNSGRLEEAMRRYEQALTIAPDYAQARANLANGYYELGNCSVQQNRHDEAARWFEKSVAHDPQNFRALNNLGNLRRTAKDMEAAAALYRQALAIRPDYAEAHANLGTVLRDLGTLDGAMLHYREAARLKPHDEDILINIGTLLQQMNRQEEAIVIYDSILSRAPDSVEAKWNKALASLALGDYAQGWTLHESGLGHTGKRGSALFSVPQWNGGSFVGQRLLIWSEQGLGDSLQFIRYAALCKQRGGDVIVQCPQPLARLFANCPFIDEVVSDASQAKFDHHISMMSLPYIFGTTLDTIPTSVPYLFVNKEARQKWAPKFAAAEGLKIGLVWAGNAREGQIDAHLIDKRRSLNLAELQPLFDFENARFYNLQMGAAAAQINEAGLRECVIDHMAEVDDFLDTAALIEHLDLIISVDTSVAHLAGALGKPVWILSRFDACWRWLRNRENSPWYPTARIFGQPAPGNWNSAISNVCIALRQLTGE